MGSLEQVNTKNTSPEVLTKADRLALYDKYSSMAYGVILPILPEPELAQTVLVDLFASLQLTIGTRVPTAIEIIRLARTKALAAKPMLIQQASVSNPIVAVNDGMSRTKRIFNLSFCQGYSIETIAEQLQLSQTNVLKEFYTYFKHLRSS
ncbi:hypothetical protein [Spirosoma sp. KNUC1025]|uniref:hypothetical protein n=1 Tax=Spirosoma sp. KNUC1025 TaxID=2894082 RepID=UPI0038656343|nr:hypothetical protein LN737_08525 [Spirosoma sp. KNUC1025]